MTLHVDVNGKAKPNKLGRDVFTFQVYPFTNQDVPNCLFSKYENESWKINDDDEIESFCNLASRGDSCSAKIIRDGWQMKY